MEITTYQGRDNLLYELGFKSYGEYLRSDLWDTIKKKAKELHGCKCRVCGKKAKCFHHASYDEEILLGDDIAMLVPLCHSCHKKVELNDKGGKRSFLEAQVILRRMLGESKTEPKPKPNNKPNAKSDLKSKPKIKSKKAAKSKKVPLFYRRCFCCGRQHTSKIPYFCKYCKEPPELPKDRPNASIVVRCSKCSLDQRTDVGSFLKNKSCLCGGNFVLIRCV